MFLKDDEINFEIAGICNAKCPYCVTGASNHDKGGFVDVKVFKETLEKLLQEEVIKPNATINLYNWGEPTLHPEFGEIIDIINNMNFKYVISTNAGKTIDFKKEWFKNLSKIIISMPGFSQESYDKIHGFNFEKVKNNIINMAKKADESNFKGDIIIRSHLYQFNIAEMKDLERFSVNIGAYYEPYFAFLNDWWKINSYIDLTMPFGDFKKASEDIFCNYMKKGLNNSPNNYCCPQFGRLNIDENANIITCCVLPRNHSDYTVGNIFNDNLQEILEKKDKKSVCKECINKGIAYYSNNFIQPDFYYPSKFYKNFIKSKNRKGLKKLIALGWYKIYRYLEN